MSKLCDVCLEKDKQYELSCLVYAKLLMARRIKSTKRGKWWHRLAIDLKHLRLRKDSLKMAESGLRDSTWVKTGEKTALISMRDALTKTKKSKKQLSKEDEEPK